MNTFGTGLNDCEMDLSTADDCNDQPTVDSHFCGAGFKAWPEIFFQIPFFFIFLFIFNGDRFGNENCVFVYMFFFWKQKATSGPNWSGCLEWADTACADELDAIEDCSSTAPCIAAYRCFVDNAEDNGDVQSDIFLLCIADLGGPVETLKTCMSALCGKKKQKKKKENCI